MNEAVIASRRDYSGETNSAELDVPLFDFNTIAQATDNFSDNNKLGQGGFGSVYKVIFFILRSRWRRLVLSNEKMQWRKVLVSLFFFELFIHQGVLEEGEEIAVKRLSKNSGQGVEEFKNEVRLIVRLQHVNLVRLLGGCIEMDEKMLIYEFMEHKSLDSILFGKSGITN